MPQLRVSEMYCSIQGEGTNMGTPTMFLRFAGCNMRCPGWPCDTPHAIEPSIWLKESEKFEIQGLVDRIQATTGVGVKNICWTGGEPFIQPLAELQRLYWALFEKGYSQDYIYLNQSLVSQIEKGVNKNPTEQTLRIMANNMDISFEELIEGTNWDIPRNLSRKSEYAFSQTECVVTIDDSGEIISKMKSYPLKEDSGEENKFDPDTGYKLLTGCANCNRAIQQLHQAHCFGCGESGDIFNFYMKISAFFYKILYLSF